MDWKEKIRRLHEEIYILYLALRDPRVKWPVKALAIAIVAYALSPVDLIPDFIPLLGYMDDLVILPAGIYLVRKMISREILEEYRQKAMSAPVAGKSRWIAAGLVIAVWMAALFLIVKIIWL